MPKSADRCAVECALFRVMLPFESVTNLVVTEEPKRLQHWERQSADPLVSANIWSCEARLHIATTSKFMNYKLVNQGRIQGAASLSSLPLSSRPLPFPFIHVLLSFRSRVPLEPAKGLRERRELPQWSLGRSRGQKQIRSVHCKALKKPLGSGSHSEYSEVHVLQ